MDVPDDRYRELDALITSAASPVGIDAKKTHVMILYMLEDMAARLARIEERLDTRTP